MEPDRSETRGSRGTTAVSPTQLGMAHKQAPKAGGGKTQTTVKVGETVPSLESLGQPHLSGRDTGSVFHPE